MELKIMEKSNEKIWSKTILSIYRTLETLVRAIDNLVLERGRSSGVRSHMFGSNTFNYMNGVIDLIERKRKLINLKLIIESALLKLGCEQQRVLMLTYFDKVKSAEIASLLNCSARTYFRKKEVALNSFTIALKNLNYGCDYLEKNYLSEKWLMDYYFFNTKYDNEENVFNKKFVSNAIRDLKTS